jgi:hypothetical protein
VVRRPTREPYWVPSASFPLRGVDGCVAAGSDSGRLAGDGGDTGTAGLGITGVVGGLGDAGGSGPLGGCAFNVAGGAMFAARQWRSNQRHSLPLSISQRVSVRISHSTKAMMTTKTIFIVNQLVAGILLGSGHLKSNIRPCGRFSSNRVEDSPSCKGPAAVVPTGGGANSGPQ